jgi:hypothetical protein
MTYLSPTPIYLRREPSDEPNAAPLLDVAGYSDRQCTKPIACWGAWLTKQPDRRYRYVRINWTRYAIHWLPDSAVKGPHPYDVINA